MGSSVILSIIGALFGYYMIIPMSLHFFNSYASASIKPLISVNEYLSYFVGVIVTFVILFQIPLLILFINFVKPLNPKTLLKYQRHVIVGALVLAVLLPFTYDPLTQFVLAAPIVALYYLSIILIVFVNRQSKKPQIKYSFDKNIEDLISDTPATLIPSTPHRPVDDFRRPISKVQPTLVSTVSNQPQKIAKKNLMSIDGVTPISRIKSGLLPVS
jgi:hypothetical protein